VTAGRPLTGRGVATIAVAAFGVVIVANLILAWQAVGTFPGTETASSYVASQRFEAERRAQAALGWQARAGVAGGVLTLALTDARGRPAPVAALSATLGRPTHRRDDLVPDFRATGGHLEARVALAPGLWHLRLEARAADGTAFRQRLVLRVPGGGGG